MTINLCDRPYQVGVFGSGNVDSRIYDLAYQVGSSVAQKGHIVINGGHGGVMEASAKGAAEANGLVIGILPDSQFSAGNRYSTVKILTGMHYARNQVNGLSCHGAIVVGGSSGAYEEARRVWEGRGPVVVLANSGSNTGAATAMIIRQETFGMAFPEDKPKPWKVFVANSPAESVSTLLSLIKTGYPNA